MAKIQFDKLAKGSLFERQIKEGKSLLKILKRIQSDLKGMASDSKKILSLKKTFGSAEELEKIEKEIEKVNVVTEESIKLQKQKEKLQAKLQASQGAIGIEIAKSKIQQQKLNKAQKEAAKRALGLVGEYEKQSKRLVSLRKQFKDMRLEQGKSTKETRALQKEITRLDRELKDVDESVGQFSRNVGNYEKAVQGARNVSIKWLGAIGGLIGGLSGLNKSLQDNEESNQEFRKVQSQVGAAVSTVTNRIGKATANLFALGKGLLSGNLGFRELLSTSGQLRDTFKGVTDEINDNVNAAGEAEARQIELEKASRRLREELSRVSAELNIQNAIAGDTTKSFSQQEEAARKVTRLNIERSAILRDIAEEELNILLEQLAARGESANNLELLNQISEKRIELTDLQNELDLAQIDNQKVLREVQRDRFERELDFAVDAFDAVKTVNERRIADDRKTLSEREAIFDQTVLLADSAFSEQIKLVEGFLGQQTDLQELVLEEDEGIIRDRLRNLTADDVALGRILEIIRERKFVLQDLADIERDLSDEAIESAQRRTDALGELADIEAQRRIDALSRELKDENLSFSQREALLNESFDKRADLLVQQATFQIATQGKTAEEIKVIEAQLQNDLLNLTAERNEAQMKLELMQQQERADAFQAAVDTITEIQRKASQDRLNLIDKEIQEREKRQDQLVSLAEAGSSDAVQNLAFEQRREAELRAQREKEIERQKRIELGITALNTYSAKVTQGDDNPLASTIRDISLLRAFITSLPSFYEGTEDTGSGGDDIDDKGGFHAVLHPHERVVDAENNSKLKGISNNDLADIGLLYKQGALVSPSKLTPNIVSHTDDRLIEMMHRVEGAIKGLPKKMPQHNYIYDDMEKAIVYTVKKHSKTERYHKKVGRLF